LNWDCDEREEEKNFSPQMYTDIHGIAEPWLTLPAARGIAAEIAMNIRVYLCPIRGKNLILAKQAPGLEGSITRSWFERLPWAGAGRPGRLARRLPAPEARTGAGLVQQRPAMAISPRG